MTEEHDTTPGNLKHKKDFSPTQSDGDEPTFISPAPESAVEKTITPDDQATFIGAAPANNTDTPRTVTPTTAASADTQIGGTNDATFITPVDEESEKTLIGAPKSTSPVQRANDTVRHDTVAKDSTVGPTSAPQSGGPKSGAPTAGGFELDQQTFVTAHSDVDTSHSDPDSNAIGTIIGEYEVIDELGRGGMGVVYKARHTKLNRIVALKMILNGAHTTPQQLERFLTEARAVAALQHPNIVQIFDIGEQDGLPWFTLEFVDGSDLQGVLKGVPQTPEDCARTVETLARAMHYAHEQNIIHRDLKPANVLVSKDGVAKVTDFGLAKELEDLSSEKTRTGTIMGSPSYMSPEQAEGKTAEVGPPSDQYSLGAVLYQMITARAPFAAAKPLDTITQVVKNEPIPPRKFQPEVPADLETICLKTLQKDPQHRYANCLELAEDLARYTRKEPILARPVSWLESAWKWCRRNPKIAIPSAASVGLLLLTALISTWSWFTVAAANAVIQKQKAEVVRKNTEILEEKTKVERQKEIAEDAQALAEENEKVARTQADLTLKNLQTFINKIDGRLASQPELRDLRLEVLTDISAAWDQMDDAVKNDKKGEAIPTRMGARFKLAQIFQDSGNLKDAYNEAIKLYETGNERQILQQWTDATRMNQVRIILMLIGPLRRQIDRDQALVLKHYEEAVRLCRDTLENPKKGSDGKGTPVNVVNSLLSESLQRVGVSQLFEGKVAAALATFSEALEIREEALRTLLQSADYQKLDAAQKLKRTTEPKKVLDLSRTAVAYALLRHDQPDDAIKMYAAAYDGRKLAAAEQPDNNGLQETFAGIAGNWGLAWHWMNQLKKSRTLLEESVEIYRQQFEADKESALLKRRYGTALYRVGAVLFDLGQHDEAQAKFTQCKALRAELAATGGVEFRKHYMQVLARVGELEESRKLAAELGETKTPDPDMHWERAQALSQIARQTDGAAKPAALDAAFAALNKCIDDGYSDPFKVRVEPDFKPLRADERFATALRRIEERNAAKASP